MWKASEDLGNLFEKGGLETKGHFKRVWEDLGDHIDFNKFSTEELIDITVEEMGDALTAAAKGVEEGSLKLLYGQLEAAGIEGAAEMSEEELLAYMLLLDAEMLGM